MQAVQYGEAKDDLNAIIHKVCNDFDEYVITTEDKKSAVLISFDEYNSLKETMYLLSSKNNRDRLNKSVEQIENLEFTKRNINL